MRGLGPMIPSPVFDPGRAFGGGRAFQSWGGAWRPPLLLFLVKPRRGDLSRPRRWRSTPEHGSSVRRQPRPFPFGAVEISDAVGEPSAPTHIEVDGHVGTESSSSETAYDVTILVYIEYTGLRARALRPCPDLPGAGSRDTRGPMGTPIGTVWDTRGVLAGPKGGRPVRLFPCTH